MGMTSIVYHIRNGIANTILCLHLNTVGKYFIKRNEKRWEKYCDSYANGRV